MNLTATHMGHPVDPAENHAIRMKTPPLMIASLATVAAFDEEPSRAEIAVMRHLTNRMAALARREPFILMADGTTLLISVYTPPPPSHP